jgi:hypothetical protein
MNAPYCTCAECGRRLCAYRDSAGGIHVMPHKRAVQQPDGTLKMAGVCPGRLRTDHELERTSLV